MVGLIRFNFYTNAIDMRNSGEKDFIMDLDKTKINPKQFCFIAILFSSCFQMKKIRKIFVFKKV